MEQINSSKDLSKFIFNKSQFSSVNNRVKYSAFIPPPNKRLSMFCISSLKENKIWGIGQTVKEKRELAEKRELTLLARADIKALSVTKIGLEIEADNIPLYHVNIVGWPDEGSEMKLKAIELAKKAKLRLR